MIKVKFTTYYRDGEEKIEIIEFPTLEEAKQFVEENKNQAESGSRAWVAHIMPSLVK